MKIEAASFINLKSVAWEQNTEVSMATKISVCWTGIIKLLFTKMEKTEKGAIWENVSIDLFRNIETQYELYEEVCIWTNYLASGERSIQLAQFIF